MEQAVTGTRAAARPWRHRSVLVLATGVLALTAFHFSGAGGLVAQTMVVWSGLAVLHCTLGLYAWRVAGHPGISRAVRRFWLAVGVTATAFLVGDIGQFIIMALSPAPLADNTTGSGFQSACVDVGAVTTIVALVMSPLGFATSRERARFWLDTATVMAAAAAFGWYFTLVPGSRVDDGSGHVWQLYEVLFGPVIMLVGMFVAVKVLLSARRPFTRLSGILLVLAAGMEGLATGVGGALEAQDMVAPVFALTILGNGLLAATAVVQRLQLNADPNVLTTARKRSYSLLPYGAIAATYVLLLVVLQDGLDLRTWLVFGAAAASTSLVVVRQLAAFIENERLLGELDAKVTERDQLAAALHHLAFHDSLTGLANRVLFTDRLDADLARGRRAGTSTAVMLIDLDDFKPVNDHLGHRAGDDLLMEIACRLRACVRETDTVARLGGDEFAVLLEHPLDDGVRSVAARMVRVIGEPVIVNDGDVVSVGASVGVAVGWPGDGAAASLLNDADLAMYRAKKRGKGAYEISGNPARDRRYITPPGGLASDDEQLAGPVPSSNGKQPRRRRSDRVPTGALGEDSP